MIPRIPTACALVQVSSGFYVADGEIVHGAWGRLASLVYPLDILLAAEVLGKKSPKCG